MMESTALLVKLRWEQQRVLQAVQALEAHVAAPCTGDTQTLATLRWSFTRELLFHFAHLDKQVLLPLMGDGRGHAAHAAARSNQDMVNVLRLFKRHGQEWHDVDGTRWCPYREALALLMRRIRVRLAAQDSDIYPLLPIQPGSQRLASAVEPIDYTAEAWSIRALIYPVSAARHAAG